MREMHGAENSSDLHGITKRKTKDIGSRDRQKEDLTHFPI